MPFCESCCCLLINNETANPFLLSAVIAVTQSIPCLTVSKRSLWLARPVLRPNPLVGYLLNQKPYRVCDNSSSLVHKCLGFVTQHENKVPGCRKTKSTCTGIAPFLRTLPPICAENPFKHDQCHLNDALCPIFRLKCGLMLIIRYVIPVTVQSMEH